MSELIAIHVWVCRRRTDLAAPPVATFRFRRGLLHQERNCERQYSYIGSRRQPARECAERERQMALSSLASFRAGPVAPRSSLRRQSSCRSRGAVQPVRASLTDLLVQVMGLCLAHLPHPAFCDATGGQCDPARLACSVGGCAGRLRRYHPLVPRLIHRSRLIPPCQGAVSFENAPPEALLAGGAVALLALAGIGYAATQQQGGAAAAPSAAREPELPREDAVLVFGATGRMGRTLVNSVSCRLGVGLERKGTRLPARRIGFRRRLLSVGRRQQAIQRQQTKTLFLACLAPCSSWSRAAPWWRRCAALSARATVSAGALPAGMAWRLRFVHTCFLSVFYCCSLCQVSPAAHPRRSAGQGGPHHGHRGPGRGRAPAGRRRRRHPLHRLGRGRERRLLLPPPLLLALLPPVLPHLLLPLTAAQPKGRSEASKTGTACAPCARPPTRRLHVSPAHAASPSPCSPCSLRRSPTPTP